MTATFSGDGPLSIILLIKPRIIYPPDAWLTLPIAYNMAASLGPKKGEITYAESFVCFTSLTLNYCAKHTGSR